MLCLAEATCMIVRQQPSVAQERDQSYVIIIIMEIRKGPTLQLKVLNKHNIENVH